jgi:GNAT superfamily N-acetyltransferase
VTLVPASQLSVPELADLFTRAYEGYYVPVAVDETAMRYMIETWDIDLERSRVDPGRGFCNLGVRGDRGWIGGVGVAPEARRQGVGRALMDAVLELAPPTVTLEVLEQNEPARALYERLGFVERRMLEVWTLTVKLEPAGEVRRVEPRPLGQEDLPWQRADASLPHGCERIDVDGGAALFRVTEGTVGIAQLAAADEQVARELLRALRARGSRVSYVNVPEGDPASAALQALGGSLDLRQYELEWFATSRSSATTD